MAWTHVRHRVEDYPKWKEGFDSTAGYKRSHGWKGYRIHAIEGDKDYLLVMEEFETEDQTREFLASEYLREAIGSALSAITARDARGYFRHCGYPLDAQPS